LEFPTLDGANVKGKVVLVRVDINSPLDLNTGEILDDTRIHECAPTLKELAHKGAKVVVMAHQGRPGDRDFTTLEKHAKKLSEAVGLEVTYLPDVFGPHVKSSIMLMRPGEIMLLDNIRLCAEENLNLPPEEQAKTLFVRMFAPLAHLYVNDAFGAVHRSSPSLVGFSALLPSYAGRLMERELSSLSRALSPERPCVYVLGGVKIDDSIDIIDNVLGKGIADLVLTGGLVGNIFLVASERDLGKANLELLKKKGLHEEIDRAKRLLHDHGDKIKIPLDLVVDAQGQPKELSLEELPTELVICDIGPKTVEEYTKLIVGAKTVVANGPLGITERAGFERGTFEVLKAMAGSQAYTIIGGGHMVAVANAAGVTEQIKHISTGGGACISFLSGEPLPAVEALVRTKRA
jgi:phosphoglycerate kinase